GQQTQEVTEIVAIDKEHATVVAATHDVISGVIGQLHPSRLARHSHLQAVQPICRVTSFGPFYTELPKRQVLIKSDPIFPHFPTIFPFSHSHIFTFSTIFIFCESKRVTAAYFATLRARLGSACRCREGREVSPEAPGLSGSLNPRKF